MLTPHRFASMVGKRLGREVSVRVVTRLCRHGRIKSQRVGIGLPARWLIDPAEVERVAREGLTNEL